MLKITAWFGNDVIMAAQIAWIMIGNIGEDHLLDFCEIKFKLAICKQLIDEL